MNEYFQMYNYGDNVFNTLGEMHDSCFSLRFSSPNMLIQKITFRKLYNQLSKIECRLDKNQDEGFCGKYGFHTVHLLLNFQGRII